MLKDQEQQLIHAVGKNDIKKVKQVLRGIGSANPHSFGPTDLSAAATAAIQGNIACLKLFIAPLKARETGPVQEEKNAEIVPSSSDSASSFDEESVLTDSGRDASTYIANSASSEKNHEEPQSTNERYRWLTGKSPLANQQSLLILSAKHRQSSSVAYFLGKNEQDAEVKAYIQQVNSLHEALAKEDSVTFNALLSSLTDSTEDQALLQDALLAALFANKPILLELVLKAAKTLAFPLPHGLLPLAVYLRQHEVLEILIDHGANLYDRIHCESFAYYAYLDRIDFEGANATHIAAKQNDVGSLTILAKSGTDFTTIKNKELGHVPTSYTTDNYADDESIYFSGNPLDIACMFEHTEAREFLLNHAKQQQLNLDENLVPSVLHWIWFGGPIPETYVTFILLANEENPDYQKIVWRDPDYFNEAGEFAPDPNKGNFEWDYYLQSLGVKFANPATLEVLPAHRIAFKIALKEVDKRPVIASDIIRLLALRSQPGFYLDMDIFLTNPLPRYSLALHHRQKVLTAVTKLPYIKNSSPFFYSNYFIAATPDSPVVTKWLDRLCTELLSLGDISSMSAFEATSVTGPDLTGKFVRKSYSASHLSFPNLAKCIRHYNEGSWLSSKYPQLLTPAIRKNAKELLAQHAQGKLVTQTLRGQLELLLPRKFPRSLSTGFWETTSSDMIYSFGHQVHLIWLGKKPLPYQGIFNILTLLLDNKEQYTIHLWTNPEYFNEAGKLKISADGKDLSVYHFLQKEGATLRNIQELNYPEWFSHAHALAMEQYQTNPTLSSDILRWVILWKYGDMYFDVDTKFLKPLPIKVDYKPRQPLIFDVNSDGPNTAFIAGTKGNHLIKNIMRIINVKAKRRKPHGTTAYQAILDFGPSVIHQSLTNPTQYNVAQYPELADVKVHLYANSYIDNGEQDLIERFGDACAISALLKYQRGKINTADQLRKEWPTSKKQIAVEKGLLPSLRPRFMTWVDQQRSPTAKAMPEEKEASTSFNR